MCRVLVTLQRLRRFFCAKVVWIPPTLLPPRRPALRALRVPPMLRRSSPLAASSTSDLSAYELQRARNMQENRQVRPAAA